VRSENLVDLVQFDARRVPSSVHQCDHRRIPVTARVTWTGSARNQPREQQYRARGQTTLSFLL